MLHALIAIAISLRHRSYEYSFVLCEYYLQMSPFQILFLIGLGCDIRL